MGTNVKEIELKLVSELMKNSRRSDRELSKMIGVSQPTVTRVRTRLEKEGVIKEYTMIPDFRKIGYHLLGLTFVKLKRTLAPEEVEKVRKRTQLDLAKSNFGIIMLERGLGLGRDGVIAAYYKDYSDYTNHKKVLREYPFLEISDMDGFLISLDDEVHYRPLSLNSLASLLGRTLNQP
jgi:DNA-binding Lrp family transcriptional regulator